MQEYIDLQEEVFKDFLFDLLQETFNYQLYTCRLKELPIANQSNRYDMYHCIFYFCSKYKSINTLICDLSIDYFITCLYEMYGPVEHQHSYDKFFNKIVPGDYVVSHNGHVGKYDSKCISNRHKHKVVLLNGYSSRYLDATNMVKYTPTV